jgi:hypothetical protein
MDTEGTMGSRGRALGTGRSPADHQTQQEWLWKLRRAPELERTK